MNENYQQLDAEVIIVGAGLSGMVTALSILEKEPSLTVLVLEAQNRVGGRAFSVPIRQGVLDLGAQWVSSKQKQLINLLKSLDIHLPNRYTSNGQIILDYNKKTIVERKFNAFAFGSPIDKLEMAGFVKKIEELCQLPVLDPKTASLTMEIFIQKNIISDFVKSIIRLIILINCGAPASLITVSFYIFFCTSTYGISHQLTYNLNGLREFFLPNGAGEICEKIYEVIDSVEFGFEVREVKSNDRNVKLTTDRRSFYCSIVVMAVPVASVLKIKFIPGLPQAKLTALHDYSKGSLVKFIIIYSKPFWRAKGYSGDVFFLDNEKADWSLVCCFDYSTQNVAALSGFYMKQTDKAEELILEQLRRYFGDEVLKPVQFIEKTWTCGSPMDCLKSLEDLGEIVRNNGRILWAGAETSTEWYGCMAGAVAAGQRAANEALYELRPGLLTVSDMQLFLPNIRRIRKQGAKSTGVYRKAYSWYFTIPVGLLLVFGLFKIWQHGIYSRVKRILLKKSTL